MIANSPVSSVAADAMSVGARLRAARLAQPLPLEEIANQLCIRAVHLRALENGDYAALPALVYARGFVRSYAEFLKIDATKILDQFRVETADQTETIDTMLLPTTDNQQLPSKGLMIGAAAAVLIIIGLWSAISSPSAPVPDPIEAAGQTTDMVIANGTDETSVQTTTNTQLQVFAPIDVPPPAPLPNTPANPAVAVASPTPTPLPPAPIAAPTDAAVAATIPPAVPPAPKPAIASGITLLAESDAWVEVTAPTGQVIYSRVLRKGQSYNLPERLYGSFLSTGNAGGLLIALDGQNLGTLGKAGEVVNNIVLDAAEIRSRAVNPSL